MKNDLLLYGTEQYAHILAQEQGEWNRVYDELIVRKIDMFNKLISMHNIECYNLVEQLLDDNMTIQVEERNTNYAYMIFFLQIYRAEKKKGEKKFVFDCGDSLEELIAIVQQLKFYIWEIEFLHEREAEDLLKQFVIQYDIQGELIRHIILLGSIQRQWMLIEIGRILELEL